MADHNSVISEQDRDEDHAPIIQVRARESSSITKLREPLNDTNWVVWHELMKRVLRLCGVEQYAQGKVELPNDVEERLAWDYNDNYAQMLMLGNVTSSEMIHAGQCTTAKAMWDSLEAVHESKGHQTVVSIIRNLFHTSANDETNISSHLNELKSYWEHINLTGDEGFKISDTFFKVIISSLLPLSWDVFTESYIGGRRGVVEIDPKKTMGSQEFIGILKEYLS
jgi:hypothetical protein